MAIVKFAGSAQPEPDDDDRQIHLTDPDVLDDEGAKMSFLDHLDELRKRLIACVWGLLVGCAIGFIFVQRIQNFIWMPLYENLHATNGAKFMFTTGFEPFMLTNPDIDALRAFAKARGTYLRGSQSFNSSNRLPEGLVFVDTVSGTDITAEGVTPATPSTDFASVTIHGGAGTGAGGAFNGWLFVNGALSISGDFLMNGFAYAQNDISYHGTGQGQLNGAMVSRNIRDTSSTSIDSDLLGNATIVYDCQKAKTGGGSISAKWLIKGGTYKEVSGSS